VAKQKSSELCGNIIKDHNDKGANYAIVAFSHYAQEYMSLLLGLPNYTRSLCSEDPELIMGAAENMLITARWLPYSEMLLKLGVGEVRRLKSRFPRVYVEGQHPHYAEGPQFFRDELDSRKLVFLDESNDAYDKMLCRMVETEGGRPFVNNNDIQKVAITMSQDDREEVWAEKLEQGDGVILVGDSHVGRVAKALEKEGKKACVCLNYSGMKFSLDLGGRTVGDAFVESLVTLHDHTRRNWPNKMIEAAKKELEMLYYLQQSDVKPHLPGARRVGKDLVDG